MKQHFTSNQLNHVTFFFLLVHLLTEEYAMLSPAELEARGMNINQSEKSALQSEITDAQQKLAGESAIGCLSHNDSSCDSNVALLPLNSSLAAGSCFQSSGEICCMRRKPHTKLPFCLTVQVVNMHCILW